MGRRVIADSKHPVGSRHLRWESFEARIRKGPPSIEAIRGSPPVHVFIEPAGRRVGARFFTNETTLITSPLAEIDIRPVGIGPDTALEISTGNEDLYRDFYSLCCLVADRVQLDKQEVADAVTETLSSWAALLRRRSLLSSDDQVGLLGELLFLQRIAKALGWSVAADAWQGPRSEEHDFVLPSADAEVKSTTRERRVHRISSLTQLLPKPDRTLYIVSVQLTAAGANKEAFSLSSTVASVLSAATKSSPKASRLIRDQIDRQGWLDEDAPNYETRYCLRAPLACVKVSAAFPAITPPILDRLEPDAAVRISDVSYSIDIDGLGVLDGSGEFKRTLFGSRGSR